MFELTDVKMYLRAPPVIPGHVSAVLLAAPLDAPAHVPGAGGAGRGGARNIVHISIIMIAIMIIIIVQCLYIIPLWVS